MASIIKKVPEYFKTSKDELKKVTWPTRSQTMNNTMMVLAVVIAMGVFLGGLDYLLNYLLQIVI